MKRNAHDPVEMIGRLIAFDTTSRESNLPLIDFVRDYLASHGVDSTLVHDETGKKANLYATIGPDDRPGIALSGHTDVVPVDGQPWQTDPFRLVEKDGRLYGRGTADMKSFCAIALAMVPDFVARRLHTPVHLAFSFDEEVGCLGAPLVIERLGAELGPKPKLVIVGEPTDMAVVNAHKGVVCLRTRVRGLEAHSSATHRGVNAVQHAARLIGFLADLAEEMATRAAPESRFDPPCTTIQVGTVHGGTAQNIVPLDCAFTWEYRLLPGADPHEIGQRFERFANDVVLPDMRAIDPDTGIETETICTVPGLQPDRDSPAEPLAMALARTNRTEVVAFAAEAGQFQQAGIPAVICGPGSIAQAHQPDEFIELSQVRACEAFMRRLLNEVSAD
ncbi:MAG: acetylornithine deacetylase [Gammaproteobacteria bacterium]|nr:acetylornithine deacetylase [Gammaproteobacteria bacterium]